MPESYVIDTEGLEDLRFYCDPFKGCETQEDADSLTAVLHAARAKLLALEANEQDDIEDARRAIREYLDGP